MKLLKRNETDFTYTAYAGKEEVLSNGRHTGKFEVSYAEPIPYRGNISVPSGQALQQLFGIETSYTHVLLMDNPDADIREDGLIQWKGYVYEIKAVRPSINVLAVALKKTRAIPEPETPEHGETDPTNPVEPTDPTEPNEGEGNNTNTEPTTGETGEPADSGNSAGEPDNPGDTNGETGDPVNQENPTGEVGEP